MEQLGLEQAVYHGVFPRVKELVRSNISLANFVLIRETESSKYREWSSKPEYERCESILAYAIKCGHEDIAKYLVDNGADPNYKWDRSFNEKDRSFSYKESVVKTCKEYGSPEMLQYLIDNGVEDDGTVYEKKPPFVLYSTWREKYGRSGELIRQHWEVAADKASHQLFYSYNAAVEGLVNRDIAKLVKKILDMFDCSSFKEYILNYELIWDNHKPWAAEDYDCLINNIGDTRAGYVNLGRFDYDFFLRFFKVSYNRWLSSKSMKPKPDPNREPELEKFIKETYGDDYDGSVYGLIGNLEKKYKALFPEDVINEIVPKEEWRYLKSLQEYEKYFPGINDFR